MNDRTAFDGEWVKTTPLLDFRFGADAIPTCEFCAKLSVETCWYSIKTHRFRCRRCFTPLILRKDPMPAKSERQRKAAAIAKHHPEQLYARNKGMAQMTEKQLGEFARKPVRKKVKR